MSTLDGADLFPSVLLSWTPAHWSALGTMVTAAVALAAAVVAAWQVHEARTLRKEQANPYVMVYFEPSPISMHLCNLVIENLGKTLATDVKLHFEPQLKNTIFKGGEKYDLAKSSLMCHGIPSLPPGAKITALFDSFDNRKDSELPTTYGAVVTFLNSRAERQRLEYSLDLGFYMGIPQLRILTIHDAALSLENIEQLLGKVVEAQTSPRRGDPL